jgi:RNA 3'-phosphate cyclase
MIEIDGSHGEGGGQLLRMSIALSAVTGKPVRISNIRSKRPKPGLAAQHMTAVESIMKICRGKASGLAKGSTTLEFNPSDISGNDIALDVGTAGSIALVLQASLPPSLSASDPVNLRITGGTDVKWSPPFDYFKQVFIPSIRRMGANVELKLIKRGYYPRGGGEVVAHMKPLKSLKPLTELTRGHFKGIHGISHVSNLPVSIAQRISSTAQDILERYEKVDIEALSVSPSKATGKGGALVLWAEFENTILGASCLAEKGVTAEKVALSACEELKRELNTDATMDIHCSDQILPYMAMANGESQFLVREISNHASTNMWLIEKFLDVECSVEKENNLLKVTSRRARGV